MPRIPSLGGARGLHLTRRDWTLGRVAVSLRHSRCLREPGRENLLHPLGISDHDAAFARTGKDVDDPDSRILYPPRIKATSSRASTAGLNRRGTTLDQSQNTPGIWSTRRVQLTRVDCGSWKVTPRSSFCLRVASRSRSAIATLRLCPGVRSNSVAP